MHESDNLFLLGAAGVVGALGGVLIVLLLVGGIVVGLVSTPELKQNRSEGTLAIAEKDDGVSLSSGSLGPGESSAKAAGSVSEASVAAASEMAASDASSKGTEVSNNKVASSKEVEASSTSNPSDEPQKQPINYNARIEEMFQYPTMAGGCEIVSMTSVLNALGHGISAIDFAEDFVLKVEGAPSLVNSYSGSPYDNGAAFPPAMVRAGNDYLRSVYSRWRFAKRDNAKLDKLLSVVQTGRPVLVWTTMGQDVPYFTGDVISGYKWYENEHCVVLYGQGEDDTLLVMDPLVGKVEYDRERFEEVYDACGRHAVSITKLDAERIDELEDN